MGKVEPVRDLGRWMGKLEGRWFGQSTWLGKKKTQKR